jgi:hypothetical protein
MAGVAVASFPRRCTGPNWIVAGQALPTRGLADSMTVGWVLRSLGRDRTCC